jgi:4-hydroxy-2-oxoglutarate aldolase
MKIQGIYVPATTPFDHNGDLYKVKVRHNIEKWNQTALTGYVLCGSTGEAVHLSVEERLQLFEWYAESSSPEKMLIAGTGMESARETIKLTNRAAEMGFKAALVLTPNYYTAIMQRPESQLLFFRTVADQSKIPVMLYHYPQVSGITLQPEVVGKLAAHPNIVGMKDSSGNLEGTKAYIAAAGPDFQVLAGSSKVLVDSLAAGCSGAILALANPLPFTCISIWEAHRTRAFDAAQDWQTRTRQASEVTSQFGVPGVKCAMDLKGYYGGVPRIPLAPVNATAKGKIEAAFEGLKG